MNLLEAGFRASCCGRGGRALTPAVEAARRAFSAPRRVVARASRRSGRRAPATALALGVGRPRHIRRRRRGQSTTSHIRSVGRKKMDDREVDFSSQIIFSNPATPTSLDDFLWNTRTTCTHTHTCNPPGLSATARTHTCYHTHTHVFSTDDDSCGSDKAKQKKTRKPLGNREAVRKYREKKKAHAAHLEEEVKKLRAVNQQLLKRLQGQAALEAEVTRLRTLLVDVRAKIDGALGSYPFQTQCDVGNALSCDGMAQCFVGKSELGMNSTCGPAVVNCHISPDSGQNLGMPH